MIEFQQPGDPVAVAVDLANTWDTLEAQPELLRDVDALRHFLAEHGFSGAAGVGDRDLARVRAFRDELRGVFEETDEREAAGRLNSLLEASGAVPRLVPDGGGWSLQHTLPGGGPATRLMADAAAAVAEVVSATGWARVGVCAADPCRCVFVDRTRAGNRLYCCRLCADRAVTAAYRERKRSG